MRSQPPFLLPHLKQQQHLQGAANKKVTVNSLPLSSAHKKAQVAAHCTPLLHRQFSGTPHINRSTSQHMQLHILPSPCTRHLVVWPCAKKLTPSRRPRGAPVEGVSRCSFLGSVSGAFLGQFYFLFLILIYKNLKKLSGLLPFTKTIIYF